MVKEVEVYNFAAKVFDLLSRVSPSVIKRDSFSVLPNKNNPFIHASLDNDILKRIEDHQYADAISFLQAVDDYCLDYFGLMNAYADISLNNDHKDKVLVFPVGRYVYHRKKSNEALNSLFRNLLFIPVGKLNDQGISLNISICSTLDYSQRYSTINLYYLPYPCTAMFPPDKDWLENYLDGHPCNKTYLERMARLKEGLKRPAIIFGPEMMGCPSFDKKFREAVTSGYACACAAPSYHRTRGDGERVNQSALFVAKETETRAIYHTKYMSAEMGGVTESLSKTSKMDVSLIVVPGFGLVMLAICRDYLTTVYQDLIETIQPDIVIVMSYMPDSDYEKYVNQAKSLTNIDVFTIIGNACSIATHYAKSPIVVVFKDSFGKAMHYESKTQCGKDCSLCKTCYFEIALTKSTREDNSNLKQCFSVNTKWVKEDQNGKMCIEEHHEE